MPLFGDDFDTTLALVYSLCYIFSWVTYVWPGLNWIVYPVGLERERQWYRGANMLEWIGNCDR